MLFSIDNSKVEELLAASPMGYEVSTSSVDTIIENFSPLYPNCPAGGTTYGSPALVTSETRAHLASLRRRVVDSGIPLVNSDELDAEIREMRR